jgi:flavin reductase (DIM6/NTAB) family NADH-FMN oxidoreductase RutF
MHGEIIQALTQFTYGIYVLTTAKGDEKHGMIASWVSQVSHEPPLVMVAVRKNRRTHPIVKEAGAFAIHVLDVDSGKKLLDKFKLPMPEQRFEGAECTTLETGCPILIDTLAYLDCNLVEAIDTGDHTLFIGEVVAAGGTGEGSPMTGWDYGKTYLGGS